MLVVWYVRASVAAVTSSTALRKSGVLIFLGTVVAAFVLRDPPTEWVDDQYEERDLRTEANDRESNQSPVDEATRSRWQYTWQKMMGTRQFWLIAGTFACITGLSFALTANLVSFAERSGVSRTVTTVAAASLPLADGLGRLAVGGLSDRLGRERLMVAAFGLRWGPGTLLVHGYERP